MEELISTIFYLIFCSNFIHPFKRIIFEDNVKRVHLFSMCAKLSEKLFLTRTCAYQRVRNVRFSEIYGVRTKWVIPKHQKNPTRDISSLKRLIS